MAIWISFSTDTEDSYRKTLLSRFKISFSLSFSLFFPFVTGLVRIQVRMTVQYGNVWSLWQVLSEANHCHMVISRCLAPSLLVCVCVWLKCWPLQLALEAFLVMLSLSLSHLSLTAYMSCWTHKRLDRWGLMHTHTMTRIQIFFLKQSQTCIYSLKISKLFFYCSSAFNLSFFTELNRLCFGLLPHSLHSCPF